MVNKSLMQDYVCSAGYSAESCERNSWFYRGILRTFNDQDIQIHRCRRKDMLLQRNNTVWRYRKGKYSVGTGNVDGVPAARNLRQVAFLSRSIANDSTSISKTNRRSILGHCWATWHVAKKRSQTPWNDFKRVCLNFTTPWDTELLSLPFKYT